MRIWEHYNEYSQLILSEGCVSHYKFHKQRRGHSWFRSRCARKEEHFKTESWNQLRICLQNYSVMESWRHVHVILLAGHYCNLLQLLEADTNYHKVMIETISKECYKCEVHSNRNSTIITYTTVSDDNMSRLWVFVY